MRIVIDLQGAQTESRFRGIGRYVSSFARAVVRQRGEHEVLLALNGLFRETIEPIRAEFDRLLPQDCIRVWTAPRPLSGSQRQNDARRSQAELLRESFLASLLPDVIHVGSLFEGFVDDAVASIGRLDTRTPVSVTLHDLIPLVRADQYLTPNPLYRAHYERQLESLGRAALCLANSDSTRAEGRRLLPYYRGRIVNVSSAVEDRFCRLELSGDSASALLGKFGLRDRFVLYSGGSDERKNLPRLLQAFSLLRKGPTRQLNLVLAGKIPAGDVQALQELAQNLGIVNDVRFIGYVSDEDLVALYNLCTLFVFPSLHEGFGLPVLEAMACGAPVIAANTSSLPELVALPEALFDPTDAVSIAQHMARGLDDEGFRSRLRFNALQRVRAFSWDATALAAFKAWETTARPHTAKGDRATERPKPTLALVSPLPPARTGIADYSAELIPALSAHYDIELIVSQETVDSTWSGELLPRRDASWLRKNVRKFDRVVYQIGNSPFHRHMLDLMEDVPGTVVLHDFFLGELMHCLEAHGGEQSAWNETLYRCHGYGALKRSFESIDEAKRLFPVNLGVLQSARGVIVHSHFARRLCQEWYGNRFADDFRVIPLLRSRSGILNRTEARAALGIAQDEFVVCSFGFLDPTKLNHRLLEAWATSPLAASTRCRLVFVGENHGGDYGRKMNESLRMPALGGRVFITGFASPEVFSQYLSSADMAIQLRTGTRGETSRAALDCMAYGVPLVVNANGSFAELDASAVLMLPDEFDNAALVSALKTIWRDVELREQMSRAASRVAMDRHSPAMCADMYKDAVEHFWTRTYATTPHLIDALAAELPPQSAGAELAALSEAIAQNLPPALPTRSLYLDVSATCRHDRRTGIERLVRGVVSALLAQEVAFYRIEPVYLCEDATGWHYRYATGYALKLMGMPAAVLADERVTPITGDVLVTLDLSGDQLVRAAQDGLHTRFRELGVKVFAVVFDLLPVRLPEVFPAGADATHQRWLAAIDGFDGAVCISHAVAQDLLAWRREARVAPATTARRPFSVSWFHLGSDIAGAPDGDEVVTVDSILIAALAERPTFVCVGTIEPRKAYLDVIAAFDELWSRGIAVNLVIVGAPGWQDLPDQARQDIPATIARLEQHSQLRKRLFWLNSASDGLLGDILKGAACLLAPSRGEGFGLPLVEAARVGTAILARDIPVFREVTAGRGCFFPANAGPNAIAYAVEQWLADFRAGRHVRPDPAIPLTWGQSALQLLECVLSGARQLTDS